MHQAFTLWHLQLSLLIISFCFLSSSVYIKKFCPFQCHHYCLNSLSLFARVTRVNYVHESVCADSSKKVVFLSSSNISNITYFYLCVFFCSIYSLKYNNHSEDWDHWPAPPACSGVFCYMLKLFSFFLAKNVRKLINKLFSPQA